MPAPTLIARIGAATGWSHAELGRRAGGRRRDTAQDWAQGRYAPRPEDWIALRRELIKTRQAADELVREIDAGPLAPPTHEPAS